MGCSLLSLAAAVFVAGCAGTARDRTDATSNVEGRMLHTAETFTGESTADIDGDGSISLISDRGAHCDGPYRQVTNDSTAEVHAVASNNGVASLTCSDGRTGSVLFTLGADQAIGTGMLGQDIVTLTIEE
jgi:hypothetical protein